ncbi:MAG: hypothetical protein LUG46_02670 [Erysipelotrichaceae bacterium]|nr:hypothetical protein [Erysipelotrichaceae bacterium]
MTKQEIIQKAKEANLKYDYVTKVADDPIYRNDIMLDRAKMEQQINDMKRA